MPNEIEFTVKTKRGTDSLGVTKKYAGSSDLNGKLIARGQCPFCRDSVGFRQLARQQKSEHNGRMVPVRCDSCHSVFSLSVSEKEVYPSPPLDGIKDLPSPISDYYEEALRCISAEAPNGATTLFRKVIHAIALHYQIVEEDENTEFYSMIKELHKEGHINEKLRKSLLATKDLGNDGAHINKNEPDTNQAIAVKQLIDAVLRSTIKTDQNIRFARDKHPNPHLNDKK